MRSQWLDWPKSRKIIEKARQDEATKPTKPSSVSFVGSSPDTFSITCTRKRELPVADPYAEWMQKALCQIAVPSYQSGMILWLESAHPALYSELISHLPDEVHRLWSERAPLEQFEEVLSRLVWTHREGCKLYREHLASRTKPDAVQNRCK